MSNRNLAGVFLLGTLLALGACKQVPFLNSSKENASATFTGFLEGAKLDLAPEVSARILLLTVDEGDSVQAGVKITSLEDDLVQARVQSAEANVAAAEAQLALLEKGARPEDIRRAEARVDQARAGLDAATQAIADAEAIRASPQMLLIAQAQAATRSRTAALQVQSAVEQAAAADQITQFWEEMTRSLWDGIDVPLPGGGIMHFDTPGRRQAFAQQEWSKASTASWQAWVAVKQAQANATSAEASLKDIQDQVKNPILLDTKVNQAKAARDRAAAALESAHAALQILREGASPAQLQSARAALDQTRAARAALDKELARYQITAWRDGTVDRVYYRPGEIALAGVPLIRLSIDEDLTLRVYVPMSKLEALRVGTKVSVRTDSAGDREYSGMVIRVNDRAEFTGRQVQTDNERNAQLIAVEISLKDFEGLAPGMPASITVR